MDRQECASPGGTAFLADGDVGRTPVIIGRERRVRAGPEFDDHLLKLADEEHIFEEVDRLGLGNGFGSEFLLQIAGILKRRNLPAINCVRRELGPHIA